MIISIRWRIGAWSARRCLPAPGGFFTGAFFGPGNSCSAPRTISPANAATNPPLSWAELLGCCRSCCTPLSILTCTFPPTPFCGDVDGAGHRLFLRFATEKYWHTVHGPMRILDYARPGRRASFIWEFKAGAELSKCTGWSKAENLPYFSQEQIAALAKGLCGGSERTSTPAYQIGEGYRMAKLAGWRKLQGTCETAMRWFKRSMELNPHDPYSVVRYGMCLDWIGQHKEAAVYFKRAYELDPDGLLHFGPYRLAPRPIGRLGHGQKMVCKIPELLWNPIAHSYLEIVRDALRKPLLRNEALWRDPEGQAGSRAKIRSPINNL